MIEYEDVFAKHEFDLGNFTGIQHNIDTGKAKPVKQRMRRTPVCYAEGEDAHLQKMLKAGVIQESTSGRFMIQCEACKEWYHGSCVKIMPTDALDIDEYKCSECLKRERRLQ